MYAILLKMPGWAFKIHKVRVDYFTIVLENWACRDHCPKITAHIEPKC